MSYQIDVTDTVPGPVFTLRRVIRADQVGTDLGVGLAELYAEVEAEHQTRRAPSTRWLVEGLSRQRLFHTIRHTDGAWDGFRDVFSQTGSPGYVIDVAVTNVAGSTHVLVRTNMGGLFHTIRNSDGSWTRLGDVKSQTGTPGGSHTSPLARMSASCRSWSAPATTVVCTSTELSIPTTIVPRRDAVSRPSRFWPASPP